MKIADVMDELGVALSTIPGLRVVPYYADRISPPTAVVGWPDELVFDGAFGRGMDRVELPVFVMVGRVDARNARKALAGYVNGSGPGTVKQAIESGNYMACDSVRVQSATIEAVSVAGVEYLAAVFRVDIAGTGE